MGASLLRIDFLQKLPAAVGPQDPRTLAVEHEPDQREQGSLVDGVVPDDFDLIQERLDVAFSELISQNKLLVKGNEEWLEIELAIVQFHVASILPQTGAPELHVGGRLTTLPLACCGV